MKVHLEGMGLQGCLLAHRLAQYGVDFSWNDTYQTTVAWRASTGAIYPGEGLDQVCYNVWADWHRNGHFRPGHLEASSGLVFRAKNPPHKGRYDSVSFHPLQQSTIPSYHLNAQEFVPFTRDRFARHERRQGLEPCDLYIVTHGWGERYDHCYWGWTRLVRLSYPIGMFDPANGRRPAFYFRHISRMAYAYPVPGTEWWYAGSSLIKQKKGAEKEYVLTPKYDAWKRLFEEKADGLVRVIDEGAYLTGWRPAAADGDEAWVRRKGSVLTLRPLWNSGIRHFPKQWFGVAAQLGLVA